MYVPHVFCDSYACGEGFYFLLAVHARSGGHLPLLPMKRGSALCFSAIGTWQRVSVENPGEADSGMVYNDPHNV